MTALSEDARFLLAAFAEADGPIDWGDVAWNLAGPEPTNGWVGNWNHGDSWKAWRDRRDHLLGVCALLFRDGLLEELPDGPVDMTVITAAGREVFAAGGTRSRR